MSYITDKADEYLEDIGFEKKEFDYGGFGYCKNHQDEYGELYLCVEPDRIRYAIQTCDGAHTAIDEEMIAFHPTVKHIRSKIKNIKQSLRIPDSEFET